MVVSPTVAGQADVQSALTVIQGNAANALPVTGGSMTAAGNITFIKSAAKATRLDGVDPTLSAIDHFVIAAGVY